MYTYIVSRCNMCWMCFEIVYQNILIIYDINFQIEEPSLSKEDKTREVSPCDSTVQIPANISHSNENHSNPGDSKPVNLSFPK